MSASDRPYVVHCVGAEKEADLVPAFTVSSLQSVLSLCCVIVILRVTLFALIKYRITPHWM